MSDDSDHFIHSDDEIDEKSHDKLVESVLNLNRVQHLKKPSRTEPTLKISEFNLVKSITGDKDSVQLTELTNALKSKKKHADIGKKLQATTKKSRTLPKPLEKPQAERIRRTVNYEKTRLDFDRWDALVSSNRAQMHQKFPLDSVEKVKIVQKESENYPKTWLLKSDLQKELEKLQPKVEEFHINPEKENEKFPLTLNELKEKRREAAKLRAHQSFKEAKARQQNKIKSKKYHRILRREKIREQLKEFEELQKTDPEEALKKLEDIEKARAEERFSLRHKSTGQWAKNKQIRAKYDKKSRQALAQQLTISRELTQKLKASNSDSEDDLREHETTVATNNKDVDNPWVNGIKPQQEVVDFLSGYRKYWNEQNKKKQNGENEEEADKKEEEEVTAQENCEDKKKPNAEMKKAKKKRDGGEKEIKKQAPKKKKKEPNPQNDETKTQKRKKTKNTSGDWEITADDEIEDIFQKLEYNLQRKLKNAAKKATKPEKKSTNMEKKTKKTKKQKKIDLSMPSKSKKHVINEAMNELPRNSDKENTEDDSNELETLSEILKQPDAKTHNNNNNNNIDPNAFIQPKITNLHTAIPDLLTNEEEDDEVAQQNQRDVIMEAFEDDDIARDFSKDKKSEIDKEKPKDIDLNLPGWGSWAGAMIDSTKRKRKRFILRMPKQLPRKDDNKGSLIINEKAEKKIKQHRVSEVPFPFRTVKDFEASIRAPIGNTFVPETSFKKLIRPAVSTKMGAIIEPISKNVLASKKKKIT